MFSLQSGAEEFDLYVNTEWNFFTEIEGSSRNNFRDVATSQALGNIPILFSFQNRENRENLPSQILKNFRLVQTQACYISFSRGFLPRLRILRTLKFFSHFGKATEVKVLPVYRTYSQQCVFILLENCVKKRSEDMLLQC